MTSGPAAGGSGGGAAGAAAAMAAAPAAPMTDRRAGTGPEGVATVIELSLGATAGGLAVASYTLTEADRAAATLADNHPE